MASNENNGNPDPFSRESGGPAHNKQRRIERIVKDDESSIRSDTRDLPGCPPDLSGPTGYTGDSLASDLGSRSAAPHGFGMGRDQIGHYQFHN